LSDHAAMSLKYSIELIAKCRRFDSAVTRSNLPSQAQLGRGPPSQGSHARRRRLDCSDKYASRLRDPPTP
jgi:hypothetical protein